MGRRLLFALGGNVLLPGETKGAIEEQREITLQAMRTLVRVLEPDDHLVITHGNGPVVGNILIRNAAAADRVCVSPLSCRQSRGNPSHIPA